MEERSYYRLSETQIADMKSIARFLKNKWAGKSEENPWTDDRSLDAVTKAVVLHDYGFAVEELAYTRQFLLELREGLGAVEGLDSVEGVVLWAETLVCQLNTFLDAGSVRGDNDPATLSAVAPWQEAQTQAVDWIGLRRDLTGDFMGRLQELLTKSQEILPDKGEAIRNFMQNAHRFPPEGGVFNSIEQRHFGRRDASYSPSESVPEGPQEADSP